MRVTSDIGEACPWCGHNEQLFLEPCRTSGADGKLLAPSHPSCWWAVKCTCCGTDGPMARPGPKAALLAWNTRIPKHETDHYMNSDFGSPFEEMMFVFIARCQARRTLKKWCAARNKRSKRWCAMPHEKADQKRFIIGAIFDGLHRVDESFKRYGPASKPDTSHGK